MRFSVLTINYHIAQMPIFGSSDCFRSNFTHASELFVQDVFSPADLYAPLQRVLIWLSNILKNWMKRCQAGPVYNCYPNQLQTTTSAYSSYTNSIDQHLQFPL